MAYFLLNIFGLSKNTLLDTPTRLRNHREVCQGQTRNAFKLYLLLSASLCNRALGMQNGRIRNNQITSSSEVNRFHTAWLGRLGRVKTGRYIGAWCPKHRNHLQWLKVDFGRLMKITKIATQGRQDAGHWVTSYYVSSSIDNVHWAMYRFRSSNKVRSHLF